MYLLLCIAHKILFLVSKTHFSVLQSFMFHGERTWLAEGACHEKWSTFTPAPLFPHHLHHHRHVAPNTIPNHKSPPSPPPRDQELRKTLPSPKYPLNPRQSTSLLLSRANASPRSHWFSPPAPRLLRLPQLPRRSIAHPSPLHHLLHRRHPRLDR